VAVPHTHAERLAAFALAHPGAGYTYPDIIPHSAEYMTIVCPAHGAFTQRVGNHAAGRGCRACAVAGRADKCRYGHATWVAAFRRTHGDRYEYPEHTSGAKVRIVCPAHGEFLQGAAKHAAGDGCPACGTEQCARSRSNSWGKWLTRFREAHGERYTYPETAPSDTASVAIVCPTHGTFTQSAKGHARGSGCPACGRAAIGAAQRYSAAEWEARFRGVHGDKYAYPDHIPGQGAHVTITCPAHGMFSQLVGNHALGEGCPTCGRARNPQSRWEREVGEFLRGCGLAVDPAFAKLDALTLSRLSLQSDPTRGQGLGLDWLGEAANGRRVAVECHGMWAHDALKNPQHQSKNKFKLDVAAAQDMDLVQIFEADWENEAQRPRIERHLRQRFGVLPVTRELQAQRLRLWPVDHDTARAFCDANHIQGGRTSRSAALGLHDADGMLVACMVYGTTRRYGEPCAEVHRYCTLEGVQVHQGLSVLTRAVHETEALPVRSICDTMLFSGRSYLAAGYVLASTGAPQSDYRYWWKGQWHHKEVFKLSVLKVRHPEAHAHLLDTLGREPTEMEFARHLKAFRLHGTGKLVYLFRS
jgi:hypothetical protein